jgi:AhpD family alkylhydroperoxidase
MEPTLSTPRQRMPNPAIVIPEAMAPVQGLFAAAQKGGVPPATLGLVHLRVSQINVCSRCVESGSRSARGSGESDERLLAVAAWQEAPYLPDAERAAAGARRGGDPTQRPLRPGARRRLGRGRPPLRRAGTGVPAADDRRGRRGQSPERSIPAVGGFGELDGGGDRPRGGAMSGAPTGLTSIGTTQ